MNAPVERIPGTAGIANAALALGGSILVGHSCPLVEMGLLATLRRHTLHDVATLDELAGRSGGRGIDVVVVDRALAGNLVTFASGFDRSRGQATPKLLLIGAGASVARQDAPAEVNARLALECRQQELVDTVNGLMGFGMAETLAWPSRVPVRAASGSGGTAFRIEGIPLQPPRDVVANGQPRGGLSTRALRRVCEAIERRLADKLMLTDLAAVAGVSRAHFARAFKESVGQSPHRYVMMRRVSVAMGLIKDTERSLTEIAVSMGFFDQSHFARMFAHIVGESPSAYRRRHR